MLNQLITAFHSLDLDPTAEELADVLWLALQIRRPMLTGHQLRPAEERTVEQSPENRPSMKPPPMPRPKADRQEEIQTDTATTDDSFLLYPGSPGKKTSSGLPFRTPAARMLPHALKLARALRPLKQWMASRTVYQLNEAATIEQIAETQIWLPVLQGIPERRFEMALVIENSHSMEIWPSVIAEFRRLLENHGAFRNVQTWELKSEEGKVHLYAKTHATSARSRSCKELLDPTQRRLILVVSDGVSSAWYTGQITKLLEYWGQHHPVAILQMLPQRLWRGTGLSQGLRVNLRATVANVTNRQLGDDAAESWLKDNIPKGIKVPIVTLEAESLNYWAKLVTGKGENWVQGVIFEPSTAKLEREVTATSAPTLTATERVRRFNALASPLAQQLAGYLAAAPLTLEVMRLVQQVMLPESGQIHLAEVFLGGLLKRENVAWVKYDFHDGVREILLDSRSVLEGIEVLKVVSAFIERRWGCALDFGAWLENPAGVEVELDEESWPFAKVAVEVLRRLGGEYANLAQQVVVKKKEVEANKANANEGDNLEWPTREFDLSSKYPYGQGLLDPNVFFGREKEIDHLLSKLEKTHFLAVVGSQGVGKTSLVMNGLVGGLHSGLFHGMCWQVVVLRPGNSPFVKLANGLVKENTALKYSSELQARLRSDPNSLDEILEESPLPERTNLLIFIDQFEDLFYYSQEEKEIAEFVSWLLASCQHKKVYVVITMRPEFLAKAAQFDGLINATSEGFFLVPPLRRNQLREAIENPARVFGGQVEPALVDQLLKDMENNQDSLFLMQFVLNQMWLYSVARENRPILTLEIYEKIGGLTGALSDIAEQVYANLDSWQQKIAEILFCSLVEYEIESGCFYRRPVSLNKTAELVGFTWQAVAEVVHKFRSSQLLSSLETRLERDSIITITDESLIRYWPRLIHWAQNENEFAKHYRRLEEAAVRWKEGRAVLLVTFVDLIIALDWRERVQQLYTTPTQFAAWASRYGQHFDLTMHFLESSKRAQQEEEQQGEPWWKKFGRGDK
jgi:hypothetical protein